MTENQNVGTYVGEYGESNHSRDNTVDGCEIHLPQEQTSKRDKKGTTGQPRTTVEIIVGRSHGGKHW